MLYMGTKLKSYRLDVGLVARFEAEAKVRGQSFTVFVSRALEQALGSSVLTSAESMEIPTPGLAPVRASVLVVETAVQRNMRLKAEARARAAKT